MTTYQSKVGKLTISDHHAGILSISYIDHHLDNTQLIHSEVLEQLDAYFRGKLTRFDVLLDINGTPFQQAVWQATLKIPFGTTQTYQDIANQIGKPKAVRAVGQALKKNPIPIIIPCHRVIGKNGHLTGYNGKNGLPIKIQLLELERKTTHEILSKRT